MRDDDYGDYLYEKRKDAKLDREHDLLAENQRLRSLVPLVNDIIAAIFEDCGFDRWELQDMLVKAGILREETMTEPCGELCDCASIGCEFPTQCHRIAPWFIEARNAFKEGEG